MVLLWVVRSQYRRSRRSERRRLAQPGTWCKPGETWPRSSPTSDQLGTSAFRRLKQELHFPSPGAKQNLHHGFCQRRFDGPEPALVLALAKGRHDPDRTQITCAEITWQGTNEMVLAPTFRG